MRRRLLAVLLTFSAVAVTCFAVPLLAATAQQRTQRLELARAADLDWFAALARQAVATGDTGPLRREAQRYASLYGESVLVVDARRSEIAAAGGLRADDPGVAPLVDAALRGQTPRRVSDLRPWTREDMLLAGPIGDGIRADGAIVLRASTRAAAADVAWRWAAVVLGALAALAACAVLSASVARWLLRPLGELNAGVQALTAGASGAQVTERAGPPELRDLAESFNRMSRVVGEAARTQARLVADASHQLRNPMAALRLRIDGLSGRVAEDARPAYAATVAEVERLEDLLEGLLSLATAESRATSLAARAQSPGDPAEEEVCDLGTVVFERVDAWSAAGVRAGVAVEAGEVAEGAVAVSET
ncbi:sensor histidine kinase, partial [Marinitenerispora sediminis]|uniref:sensor histidine kinase n=2 Tax=Marinitenerispora sediminis TaxID=1931232 RepID=UPI000E078272